MNIQKLCWLLSALAVGTVTVHAAGSSVGVVSHVKVLSDKVEDVSSLEAWKLSFIKPGMSDQEKARAVWQSVVKFQHQDAPPMEYLQAGGDVLDPIKLFNVYGYSYCSVASANSLALARYAGMQARGWTINQHVVPEYQWDGAWHMLDGSLITWFPKADGTLAGVEEIVAGVKGWYVNNPELKGQEAKLRAYMSSPGWKNGPEVLCNSPFYDERGWLPAATHGWYATMQEYDGSTLFPFEAGYSVGYEVNIQLRRGERLIRNWSNQGMHVNMDRGGGPACLKATVGKGALRYTPQYGDLAPGRVGNGRLEYDVPLADGAFRLGAVSVENLTNKAQVQDAAKAGTLVLRMPSSYVYLGGELNLQTVGGNVTVLFSDNNGLDWKELASISESGVRKIDLKANVFRRYDYQLKFVLKGPGTGLDALRIAHDIQHSQRPLPALTEGANTIRFSADSPEGTVTIEGSTEINQKLKQLVFTDFHPETKGLGKDKILLNGPNGEITFPITTPGDMTRLRIGTSYRAREARDGWEVQVSFDGGKSFKTVDRLAGPKVSFGKYTVVTDVPPATKSALVRFVGTQRNTTMISNLRISADYREPHGGFQPIKVSYAWLENGQPKADVHIVKSPTETYTITCAGKPQMKSIALEWAE